MPVAGGGARVHELHHRLGPLALDHEVVCAVQVQRPAAAGAGDAGDAIGSGGEEDSALVVGEGFVDGGLNGCTII